MKNPFRQFENLLRYDAHNPIAQYRNDDRQWTLLDERISKEICEEGKTVLDHIDDFYWNTSDSVILNSYLLKLAKKCQKLISESEEKFHTFFFTLLTNKNICEIATGNNDIENEEGELHRWLDRYSNLYHLYVMLVEINNAIIEEYDHTELFKIENLNFPMLERSLTLELIKKCAPNKGINDTVVNLTGIPIVIKTSETLYKFHTTLDNRVHNKKINDNSPQEPSVVEQDKLIEKITFNYSLSELGLLFELLFKVDLVKSRNKTAISRTLSACCESSNGSFTPGSIYNCFSESKRKNESENIELIKNYLIEMINELNSR